VQRKFTHVKLLKLTDIYKLEITKHMHSISNNQDQHLIKKTKIINNFTQI